MLKLSRSKQISSLIPQVIAKALHEPEFRDRLIANPKQVLHAIAMPIPEEQAVTVLESKAGQVFFVLPIMTEQDVQQLSASLADVHPQRSVRAKVLIRAAQDAGYKSQLFKEPKATLNAAGMMIPDSAEVTVLENTDQQFYIILPHIHTH
jgi:Nitrile hydratase, alpha chain